MDDLIKRSDAIRAFNKATKRVFSDKHLGETIVGQIPSAERPQGEWIDTAISIIDDMQREGIIDYEQAWEFRMRARMKGE